jgi:hypothetical protein
MGLGKTVAAQNQCHNDLRAGAAVIAGGPPPFRPYIARFDFCALSFRAMGFAVEKLWDCPIAATSLGDF